VFHIIQMLMIKEFIILVIQTILNLEIISMILYTQLLIYLVQNQVMVGDGQKLHSGMQLKIMMWNGVKTKQQSQKLKKD
jgi:hypothetical protein